MSHKNTSDPEIEIFRVKKEWKRERDLNSRIFAEVTVRNIISKELLEKWPQLQNKTRPGGEDTRLEM